MDTNRVIAGYSINEPAFLKKGLFHDNSKVIANIDVLTESGNEVLRLTEKDLSMHTLMLGGIGTGKTNLINLLMNQITENMSADDVILVFDTKGDYLKNFASNGDYIFGNANSIPCGTRLAKWNIYEDLKVDPGKEAVNLLEVCKSLFLERSEHTTNPFFPNAARDILYGYILANLRSDNVVNMNNQAIATFFQDLDINTLRNILSHYPDLRSCLYYIEGNNVQTQGVISELVQLVKEIFVGNFALSGNDSIRQIIRNRGKKIFIEYDLGLGNMLTPIYRCLLDMVLKEALSRDGNQRSGNVYIVIDEFSLLPNLQHISDGVNFGRELGVKIIAGLQNIEQMYDAYGEYNAGSILSGFNQHFFFRVNDSISRKYVQELIGQNMVVSSFKSKELKKGIIEQVNDSYILKDWVYDAIPNGAAVYYKNGYEAKIIGLKKYQNVRRISGFKRVN